MTWLKRVGPLALLLATVATAQQQHQTPERAKAGVVSGSVFAITKGGDLKPARIAHLYLLYIHRSVKFAMANPEDENSAGIAWMKNHNREMERYNTERASQGMSWSESMACLESLHTYTKALSETLDWLTANPRKLWQMLTVDADENGVFKIAVPHPGAYIIIARGQAGFNDAVWEADLADPVIVNSGAATTVKLSSPAESCLVNMTE